MKKEFVEVTGEWHLDDLEMAIKIVANWLSKKGSPADLFMAFWDKNDELNYGHQD